MGVVCFHNASEENGYLSNWYLSEFVVDGIKFSSMEQYMMYTKAMVFDDKDIARKVLLTTNAAEIKALGRQVSNYNDSVWNGMRQILIYKGLYEKFAQNEELKNQLLATGDDYLAECAVNDKIWGIGLSMSDPNRLNVASWNGQNLLGYSLMIVRNDLR